MYYSKKKASLYKGLVFMIFIAVFGSVVLLTALSDVSASSFADMNAQITADAWYLF